MKTMLLVVGIAVMASAPVLAQNSDLGLLLGFSALKAQSSVGGGGVSSSVDFAGQIDYSFQVRQTRLGALYVELPVALVAHESSSVFRSVTNSTSAVVFFTPGLRWKLWMQSRVSVYATVGGGLASFGTSTNTVGSTISTSSTRSNHGAMDFGGGLDFRLTRLVSLRCEGRDYVTAANAGGFSGRHHAAVYAGVGFHF